PNDPASKVLVVMAVTTAESGRVGWGGGAGVLLPPLLVPTTFLLNQSEPMPSNRRMILRLSAAAVRPLRGRTSSVDQQPPLVRAPIDHAQSNERLRFRAGLLLRR